MNQLLLNFKYNSLTIYGKIELQGNKFTKIQKNYYIYDNIKTAFLETNFTNCKFLKMKNINFGEVLMFTIAICDDNENDSINIENIIKSYLELKDISFGINIFKSEELLEFHDKFDLIFLDIVLDGINGIGVGQKMHERNKNVKIIYTTSNRQYFEQAVNNVHAFAYIEKPVTKDKAVKQLDEIIRYIQEENDRAEIVNFKVVEITEKGKVENKFKNFDVKDIFYFEYLNRKIKLENDNYFEGADVGSFFCKLYIKTVSYVLYIENMSKICKNK